MRSTSVDVFGAVNFLLCIWQFHVSSPYDINLPQECAIIHISYVIFNFTALKEELYKHKHPKLYHLQHQVCSGF